MNPIKFKESNCIYAEKQPEYLPLPVLKLEDKEGKCISCWQLSWKERFKILCTGKMWLSIWTFNKPLTPVKLTVNKLDLIAK